MSQLRIHWLCLMFLDNLFRIMSPLILDFKTSLACILYLYNALVIKTAIPALVESRVLNASREMMGKKWIILTVNANVNILLTAGVVFAVITNLV